MPATNDSSRASHLHASPWHGVMFVTGGGTGFLAETLSTPGASATVLDAQIPYSTAALEQLLGRVPEQAVAQETARQLAMAAFERAEDLAPGDEHLFGLGCTASLGTNREKKGAHRAHWALQTATQTFTATAHYDADRASEEVLLSDQLWACTTLWLLDPQAAPPADVVFAHSVDHGEFVHLLEPSPAKVCTRQHDGLLLLPGSFNPVHAGHRTMLTTAEQLTGRQGAFEMAIRNADKPTLDFLSLEQRLQQMSDHPVWVTNTPNFSDKAKLFPGAIFATGIDTLQRIGELRFYDNDPAMLDKALADFASQGVQFLVFGRSLNGQFISLDDVNVPTDLRALCQVVSESDFRQDISSSEIRERQRL